MSLQISSPLTPELEQLINRTIGCLLQVHRVLGPGFNEATYSRASCVELTAAGLRCEIEKTIRIRYRGQVVCQQRLDLVVESQLILEIKSVEAIHPVHMAQAVSSLRATGCRAALVVNFNVPILKQGIRRVVR